VAQWLWCCATNKKVAGSIPDGVRGIFHWHNSSDRTMTLGSIQPPTEMSTRRISWVKCGRCVRLTTLPQSCTVVTKSGNLNFLEPSGPLQACNGTALPAFTQNIILFYPRLNDGTSNLNSGANSVHHWRPLNMSLLMKLKKCIIRNIWTLHKEINSQRFHLLYLHCI
jgi:hypothetical protein